ncbi:Pimeloyl-ACP methyl ester carboxylesterase [Roseovarius azorensis]|uniref:Pimeloyl-ACP methyl ester carboxylesterase n=1 Tax=Roseovarius azorensis TaxID=1287727 RepID=A0A1H7XZE6_9RHOB|nr:alpha/beta fold hydrolase [Roseovarius azorensis]SEM39190.1 Pimeloyl-ACP methyl ester carboxylesterase [Roseovarius azorensis]
MKTEDGTINFEVSGQGVPLVLIHGVGANLGSWDAVSAELEDAFKIIRPDLRGHGSSLPIDGPYSVEKFAADIIAVMDAAGVERAHLVGFSLGGLIAQKLATDNTDRFDRIVILSAVAGRTEEERGKVVARLDLIRDGGMDAITGAAADRWFTEEFARRHPEVIENRIAELKSVHLDSYLEAYRVFGTTELIDTLHRIDRPVLVMTGEFDQGSNTRMARDMHELIPRSELIILPGLKHSVLVEASDVVAGHVREFLQRSQWNQRRG